ncbi:hypothetical protein [Streptosporangium sp. NPDC051022]|uniref:hypothetical protein n=1 Tax=Streptosporangium sp. NPDC051022 TaxID=3155752 RepID=UPI003444BEA6
MSICPTWCESTHTPGGVPGHSKVVFAGPPSAILLQDGDEAPFIRFVYPVGDRSRLLDTTVQLSADFGDVIDTLTIHNAGDFAAALRNAYRLTGGEV